MNFEFDETQVAVRELTRSLVRQGDQGEGARVSPGARAAAVEPSGVDSGAAGARQWGVGSAMDGAVAAVERTDEVGAGESWAGLWDRLGAADLLSLAVPERLGGSGLGVVEVAVLLTELGRGGLVSPGVAHLALGVLPVARLGTVAQQELLLGGGGLTGAVGRGEVVWGERGLVGTKVGVPFGAWARWGLIGVRLGDGGLGVALVDLRGAGVEVVGTPTSAGGSECTLRFSGAEPVGLLGEDRSGRVLAEVRWLGVVGGCAFGEGLLGGALELTVAHVGSRRQFGRVLAEFQAVAMQVADVRVVARTVEVVTRAACWGVGAGVGDRGDVDVAGYWVGEKLLGALEVCHHLHGGLGLDVGYPLHRYSALGRDLTRFLGGLRAY